MKRTPFSLGFEEHPDELVKEPILRTPLHVVRSGNQTTLIDVLINTNSTAIKKAKTSICFFELCPIRLCNKLKDIHIAYCLNMEDCYKKKY